MAIGIEVRVDLGEPSKDTDGLREKLTNRRALNAALGKRAEVELRAHFELISASREACLSVA